MDTSIMVECCEPFSQQLDQRTYPELFMRAKRVHGIHSITSYNRTANNHNFRSEPA
jgi:hypothetical protein